METMETDAGIARPDLRSVVMKIDNELHSEDVESLKFLCQGLVVSSKLKRVNTAHELISLLESASLVSNNDFFILADLLQYISRIDVLEATGYEETEVVRRRGQNGSHIHPFFVLLFKINEEMAMEDVKKAAFMYGKVPLSKRLSSGLDLFTVMYQHQAISPDKVQPLVQIFKSMEREDIVELVTHYTTSNGESVIRNLERQFVRSMQMQGRDMSSMFIPPARTDPPEKGLRPRRDDTDVHSKKTAHESGFTSMSNPPTPAVSGSFESVPPMPVGVSYVPPSSLSGPTVPSSPASRPDVPVDPQPQIPPQMHVDIVDHSSDQPLIESTAIPWPILKSLAQTIPGEYWTSFSNQLGIYHPGTTAVPKSEAGLYSRNLALLKQWLEKADRSREDEVTTRMHLVRALAFAGPELMAEQVARELNIDPNVAVQTLGTSRQVSESDPNEIASQASAAPESGSYQANASETRTASEAAVGPVTNQFRHLSLGPVPQYDMYRQPRGICLIINNRNFYREPGMPEAKLMIDREGTDIDRDKLADTFSGLNFIVKSYDNMTDIDMLRTINQIAMIDHSEYDCFVCCILTHGVLGALYGVNGLTIPIRDLTAPLRAQMCPSLADKPKLFFMQACQGKEKQRGHDIQMDSSVEINDLEADSPGQLIPNEADFLLGYATVPGFVSYRSKTRGSWYITKLTEMLRKYAYDHDILDILTLVNYEVGKGDANLDGEVYKQSPAPMYSLRKKLIFSPPVQMHSSVSLRTGLHQSLM